MIRASQKETKLGDLAQCNQESQIETQIETKRLYFIRGFYIYTSLKYIKYFQQQQIHRDGEE